MSIYRLKTRFRFSCHITISLCVFSLLSTVIIYHLPIATAQPLQCTKQSVTATNGTLVYHDSTYGLQVQCPTGWEISGHITPDNVVAFRSPIEKSGIHAAGIAVYVHDFHGLNLKKNVTLEDYSNIQIKSLKINQSFQ